MNDPTETVRSRMAHEINGDPKARLKLEAEHGKVYDTSQLCQEFRVIGFAAPFVVVERINDGKKGSMMFQHMPRLYFGFVEDKVR